MLTISLTPFFYQGKEQIGIRFKNDPILNILVKKIKPVKWNKAYSCWYIPLSKENCIRLRNGVGDYAILDSQALKQYLEKRNKILSIKNGSGENPILVPANIQTYNISNENFDELARMVEMLHEAGKSGNTIKTYKNEFVALLRLLKNRQVRTLTAEEVRRYLSYCGNELQLSVNTINSRHNSLKFYFEQVLRQESFFAGFARPKRPPMMLQILNEQELGKLFRGIRNKKHKAILFTAYSAGLSLSEATHLKLADIDSKRMELFVQTASGNKARYVVLSPVLLDVLRNYIKDARPRPVKYLFEGALSGIAYSNRTAQKIFNDAKKMAGIKTNVSFQGLRHSFAIHLLQKGMEVKYVQELLGHFNIRTTAQYLHIAKEKLVNIDKLFEERLEQ